jgi:hypothetical protein
MRKPAFLNRQPPAAAPPGLNQIPIHIDWQEGKIHNIEIQAHPIAAVMQIFHLEPKPARSPGLEARLALEAEPLNFFTLKPGRPGS